MRIPLTAIREAPINVQNVITYDVVIGVSNPDLKLFPGMTANVKIFVNQRSHLLKVLNAARFAIIRRPTLQCRDVAAPRPRELSGYSIQTTSRSGFRSQPGKATEPLLKYQATALKMVTA